VGARECQLTGSVRGARECQLTGSVPGARECQLIREVRPIQCAGSGSTMGVVRRAVEGACDLPPMANRKPSREPAAMRVKTRRDAGENAPRCG
jgi:hypothetical protein